MKDFEKLSKKSWIWKWHDMSENHDTLIPTYSLLLEVKSLRLCLVDSPSLYWNFRFISSLLFICTTPSVSEKKIQKMCKIKANCENCGTVMCFSKY